jgi:hypothetical protein
MRASYIGLINMIDYALAVDGINPDREEELRSEIWQEIKLLRQREAAIPGTDVSATVGA